MKRNQKRNQLGSRKFKKMVGNKMRKQVQRDKEQDENYYLSRLYSSICCSDIEDTETKSK